MRVSAQRVSQRSRYAWGGVERLEAEPLQGRLLRVADAGVDFARAIGIPDPARQRDDAVVGEHIAVERLPRQRRSAAAQLSKAYLPVNISVQERAAANVLWYSKSGSSA